jgi:hypothetical protein
LITDLIRIILLIYERDGWSKKRDIAKRRYFLQNWVFWHYFVIAGRLILYNVEFWRDNGNCLILGEKCE